MTVRWDERSREAATILQAIGQTPLIRLQRIAPPGIDILLKVEWYGPTGSVKDRIYAAMFAAAEGRGELHPGMTVIEATTGNAGIACAAVSAIKGYQCIVVMPEGMSLERKRMVEAYGARLVLTPGGGTDIDRALAAMHNIIAEDPEGYFSPREFENPDNPAAHALGGEEIWAQSGGRIDAVVAAHGTGGWISGVARALKQHDPNVLTFAIEPAECPIIMKGFSAPHGVPGISDGILPGNLDLEILDGVVSVSTDGALSTARRLARDEGLFCGPASGLNVAGAIKVAEAHPEIQRVVTVISDTGQRYLSEESPNGAGVSNGSPHARRLVATTIRKLEAFRKQLEFIT